MRKCAHLPNIPAAYAIGFTSGWGDAANVVKCGVMSGAANLMKAPLFPICAHGTKAEHTSYTFSCCSSRGRIWGTRLVAVVWRTEERHEETVMLHLVPFILYLRQHGSHVGVHWEVAQGNTNDISQHRVCCTSWLRTMSSSPLSSRNLFVTSGPAAHVHMH